MTFDLQNASPAPEAGFFLWDFVANRIHGDEAYLALHGFTDEDVARGLTIQSVIDRIHPEDSVRIGRAMPATIAGSGSYLEDYRITQPEGETVWVQSTGRVFGNERGPTYCTGLVYPLDVESTTSPENIIRDLCTTAHALANSAGMKKISEKLADVLILLR